MEQTKTKENAFKLMTGDDRVNERIASQLQRKSDVSAIHAFGTIADDVDATGRMLPTKKEQEYSSTSSSEEKEKLDCEQFNIAVINAEAELAIANQNLNQAEVKKQELKDGIAGDEQKILEKVNSVREK